MRKMDRQPPPDTPAISRLIPSHNNRLGAVLSALYMFWISRQAATAVAGNRRDSYSVLLHDMEVACPVNNDFTSGPDDLLNRVLPYRARLGNDFNNALQATQSCMEANWSPER